MISAKTRVVAQVAKGQFDAALKFADDVTVIRGNDTYNNGRYDFYVATPEGKTYEISTLVRSYQHSFAFHEAFQTITLEVVHPTLLGSLLSPPNWIVVYGPYWNNSDLPNFTEWGPSINPAKHTGTGRGLYQEIERAQIVSTRKGVGDVATTTVIAKTPEWLLAKNVLPYRVPKGTLKERLAFIAEKAGFSFDSNVGEDPDYVLPATRGGRETIWQDIQFDLGETNRVMDKRYVLRQRKGNFYLHEITRQQKMWMFEVGGNILEFDYEQSIEDYYNTIYVQSTTNSMINELLATSGFEATSQKIDYTGFATNEKDIARFGQHILVIPEQHSPDVPTAQEQADYLLARYNRIQQNASLATYSLSGIRWGDQILIAEPSNNLYGVFWVRGGEHTIVAGKATMNLDISFNYVAPDSIRSAADSQMSQFWQSLDIDPTNLSADEAEAIVRGVFDLDPAEVE